LAQTNNINYDIISDGHWLTEKVTTKRLTKKISYNNILTMFL